MRIFAALLVAGVAVAGDARAAYPVDRLLMDLTTDRALYRERMSDGAWRESVVTMPKMPQRVLLVGSNDLAQTWGLLYEARYQDGSRVTNVVHLLKSKRERLDLVPDLPPPPSLVQAPRPDNAFDQVLARAVARKQAAVVPTVTNRMGHVVRGVAQALDGDVVVTRMSDGTERRAPMRRLATARVTPSGRQVLDRELAVLATRLGADPAQPRAVAAAVAAHRGKLDTLEAEAAKSAGKAGALGALAGLAAGVAGTAAAGRKRAR